MPEMGMRMTMLDRRGFLAGATTLAALGTPSILRAEDAIKIGEINSYTAQPAFLKPYRQGWELAQEQVNAAGGVLGRKLETIFRDDAGKPEDAVRHAGDLVNAEKVDLLAGGFLSNVGLAIADFANQNKRLYVASEPLSDALVWSKGNRYTFRLRPSTYMQAAMLVEEAAKLPAKKWAIVAPNYEYGQSAVNWFKELLKKARPDVEFVAEQFPALGRIDAGATVQALEAAKPEAIFNVTFAADLDQFRAPGQYARPVRGARRRLHADRRAGISRSARRRDAGGLDRHRLPACRSADAGARQVPRRLQGEVQRLSAAGLGRRLRHGATRSRRRWPRPATTDNEKLVDAFEGAQVRHPPSARPSSAPSTTSRRSAPSSARRALKERQGRDGRLELSRRREVPAERRRGESCARPAEARRARISSASRHEAESVGGDVVSSLLLCDRPRVVA